MFAPFYRYSHITWDDKHPWEEHGWAIVTDKGSISINSKQRGSVDEWIYVLAHCLLHLGFEHFEKQKDKQDKGLWNIVCDAYIAEFLKEMKIGRPPKKTMEEPFLQKILDEKKLYEHLLLKQEDIKFYTAYGVAGKNIKDMYKDDKPSYYYYGRQKVKWQDLFAQGLANSVTSAVKAASGQESFFWTGRE